MTVDELQVLITANTEGLRKGLNDVKGKINDLTNTTNKMGNNMVKNIVKGNVVTLALSKTFQLLSSQMGNAVSRLDTLNNFPTVMGNLGISSELAEKSINYLSEHLKGLPTSLDDAAASVQRLTSANGNIEASTKMFLAMNNAILAGGGSMQTQQAALEQLSQAYSKGKPDMMEWRTLMTAMPAQLKQVGIAMGYASADQLGAALREGRVSMNEFMKTMNDLNEKGLPGMKSFREQAEGAVGGVQTSIANLKTAITRGLANIMDAIGQSNIAHFFNTIADVVDRATKYVIAFVKVVVTAVNYVSKLFGGKSVFKTAKKDANSASGALTSLGTSGSSASKGMDKASGSAKKLKKELAGLAAFDEMNVLKENDSGSSGGSGGSSGDVGGADMSGIDLGGLDGAISKSNDEVDKLYQKMINALKWFTEDMNFQPLVDSFYNLGDAIEKLVNGVGGLLKDFVEHVLKPLATWTVNKALPDFFNATANAIRGIDFEKIGNALKRLWDAITPFAINVGEGLLWFYKEVLLPIGKLVINDVVPAFLDMLSGAIKIVNKVIEDAKPIFKWLFDNILKPLGEWTGGVIADVLQAIGDALQWIAGNEVAVTILEALAITLGVIAGVIATLAAAFTVWDVVAGIAAGVTTALGVAFTILTSPITLVILAITALLAGVILLVKHWDEVKATAVKVWEKIKEAWSQAVDWFKDTFSKIWEGIKEKLSPWVEYFQAIWDSIKLIFSVVKDVLSGNFSDAWDKIKAIVGVWKDYFTGVWDKIKGVFGKVKTFFKDTFKSAYDAVKSVFSPIADFFGGIWDKIKGKFKDIGTKVGNVVSGAFKGVVNGILGAVEKILNAPIRAVNNLIGVINKVPGVNLNKLNTFNLPRMATGGIVDKPTYALVGENGKEAVMPLENNTEWMDMLAEKLDNNQSNGNITIKIGEDTIFNKIIDGINQKSFETNGMVFRV